MTDAPLSPQSVIGLHDLVSRPDEDGWIIGRTATGEFVALPDEAKTLIDLLGAGETIAESKRRADLLHDTELDVLGFVEDLVELGFVAVVADRVLEEGPIRPPSLAWLRPHHLQWVFSRPIAVLVALFIPNGFAIALSRQALPTYQAFFALPEPGMNALIGTALILLVVAVHEFWHLAAARAAGVDGWFGWGTRLTFLVAQTSVPGLWAADRRVRIRVFLVGMTSDLSITACCLLGSSYTPTASLVHRLCEQVSLSVLLMVATQFAVFMRTDLYLVVQELSGCKNLYADALDRLRWLARRRRGDAPAAADPTLALPPGERRPVRIYAVAVALGSGAALALFCCYQLPIAVETVTRAVEELVHGLRHRTPAQVVDAGLVLGVTALFQGLFIRTFVRKRRSRLQR